MGIKQTSYTPLPHKHPMSEITDMTGKLFGNQGRLYVPLCEMLGNVDYGIGPSTNNLVGGGYSSAVDTAEMFYGAGDGAGGGNTSLSRIKIPYSGRYQIDWQIFIDGIGTSVCTATILKNGTNSTSDSVAVAQGAGNGWSGPHASANRTFNAGDILYFHAWSPVGGQVKGYWFGDSRTRASVMWLGDA